MSGLFKINDTVANKISYYHILLLMATLPFDMFYSHVVLISFGLHTLINLNKKTFRPVFKLRTLVLQSVFFISLFSLLYTINTTEGFNELGKRAIVIIFPILFCLNPIDLKKYRPQLFLFFSLICTAIIIYLYVDALVTIKHFSLPFKSLFSSAFNNHNFSEPINMHATFFSMQVALALIYLLSLLVKEQVFNKKVLYTICTLILIAGLIQLSSKSVCIALALIINIVLPYFLLQGVKRRRMVWITASLSVLLLACILYSGTLRERYINQLTEDLSPAKKGEVLDSRLARWTVVIKLIGKAPLAGYGAGAEVGLLHENFFNNKLYNSFINNLNAHNQYLSMLIKSGIIGLLVYMGTLAFGINISFQQKDLLFLSFMIIIIAVSFSENYLDVDKGLFYYAFFFPVFLFSNEQAVIDPELAKPS